MGGARKRTGMWVRKVGLAAERKVAIAAACDAFIETHLRPRFLPEIHPTEFNYPVDLLGRWRGNKYSFIVRYRSGFADNAGEEFDAAYTRLDHVAGSTGDERFDVMWHRHTGQWFRMFPESTLEEALQLIGSESMLQPVI